MLLCSKNTWSENILSLHIISVTFFVLKNQKAILFRHWIDPNFPNYFQIFVPYILKFVDNRRSRTFGSFNTGCCGCSFSTRTKATERNWPINSCWEKRRGFNSAAAAISGCQWEACFTSDPICRRSGATWTQLIGSLTEFK